MNKNKSYIIILILALFLIFFVENIFNDSNRLYTVTSYDREKQITDVSTFKLINGDTIFHGKFQQYNKNGVKILEGQFINGDIYGRCKNYYENGKLKQSYFKKNSKITLESSWFYPNSKIEKYVLYSDFGVPIFEIDFNEDGKIKRYRGNIQIEVKLHKIDKNTHEQKQVTKNFKVGDKLNYSFIIGNIPNANFSHEIENVGLNNSLIKRVTKKIEPCQIDVEEVLYKKGRNTIRSIVKYEFNDKLAPVLTDTISFDINVN